MKIPEKPVNEIERQCALDDTGLIAKGVDERFDRITRLACSVFSVPIALVSIVDQNRQWFKSCQGLEVTETPRNISFCGHAILDTQPLIVSDTLKDFRFADNPLVTGSPNIRFYAGVPIVTKAGFAIGTLCIIDVQPRFLTPEEVSVLVDLAATVETLVHQDEAMRQATELMRSQLDSSRDVLQLLNTIAFNSLDTLDRKFTHALQLARQFLKMDCAYLSQIEENTYTLRWLDKGIDVTLDQGQQFDLKSTWCQLIFSDALDLISRELFINNTHEHPYHLQIKESFYPAKAVVSVAIEAEGRCFGTLSFISSTTRVTPFSKSEEAFIRLLSRWFSNTLDSSMKNERLTKLMAQLPGTVFQFRRFPDGSFTFPFSSPQIESLYGITPEQAAEDASPAFARIYKDDIDNINTSIEHSAATLENWQATFRVSDQQENYRWISGQARPERLLDGSVLWHGYLQDIHEYESARRMLKSSEARLRGLFDFSPIGIALNDFQTGVFLDGNEALLKPSGYSKEEFMALSYWDLTPEKYRPKEEQALASLQTTGRYSPFEKEYIRKDGSCYPVRLQGILTEEMDGRQVIWSLIEDISDRHKLDRMKDQFIATVSHELRTPLTSIKGALSLLIGGAVGALPEKAMPLLSKAERNAQRLNELINDLLDMEKLVAGKMRMNLSVQPLGGLLDEAIDLMQSYGEQHRVSISKPESWPELSICVDGPRFIQVLTNLLSNAVKYSPENGCVEVSVTPSDQSIKISIRDHGPGVPAEFQHQLFKRFSQADSSDTRRVPGTGLGLAITQEIIHQLGGEVHYREAQGGGSEFYILLQHEVNS